MLFQIQDYLKIILLISSFTNLNFSLTLSTSFDIQKMNDDITMISKEKNSFNYSVFELFSCLVLPSLYQYFVHFLLYL